MLRSSLFVLLVVTLLPGTKPVSAQGQALTVLKRNDLRFGTVIAGLPRDIAVNSPQAGVYEIQGRARQQIHLSVSAPVALSSGTATVPIEFSANHGAWNTQNQVAGMQVFDPRQGANIRLSTAGRAWVWLGGRLAPDASARAGQYTAIITLSAAAN